MKFVQWIVRIFFSITSVLFPKLAGKMAFELFQHPHSKKTRTRELALFEKFEERRVSYPGEDIYVYEKGPTDGYPVILVHGWESNPGSMYEIADALFREGYQVKVLGLPAHGRSGLKKTNMFFVSRYIRGFLQNEGITDGFSMVTHSFGSGATTIALMESGIQPDQLIFLSSPDRIMDIFDNFREMIKLGSRAYSNLLESTEKMIPYKMVDFNISEFLREVNFNKLVIIHDVDDKILPFKNAEAIKKEIPEAELIALQGKGHYRMLWDDEIVGMVVDKLKM